MKFMRSEYYEKKRYVNLKILLYQKVYLLIPFCHEFLETPSYLKQQPQQPFTIKYVYPHFTDEEVGSEERG